MLQVSRCVALDVVEIRSPMRNLACPPSLPSVPDVSLLAFSCCGNPSRSAVNIPTPSCIRGEHAYGFFGTLGRFP